MIVESTVQHKAIAHPNDSRLLEATRVKLVEAAQQVGIHLKQTFCQGGQGVERQGWAIYPRPAV